MQAQQFFQFKFPKLLLHSCYTFIFKNPAYEPVNHCQFHYGTEQMLMCSSVDTKINKWYELYVQQLCSEDCCMTIPVTRNRTPTQLADSKSDSEVI